MAAAEKHSKIPIRSLSPYLASVPLKPFIHRNPGPFHPLVSIITSSTRHSNIRYKPPSVSISVRHSTTFDGQNSTKQSSNLLPAPILPRKAGTNRTSKSSLGCYLFLPFLDPRPKLLPPKPVLAKPQKVEPPPKSKLAKVLVKRLTTLEIR